MMATRYTIRLKEFKGALKLIMLLRHEELCRNPSLTTPPPIHSFIFSPTLKRAPIQKKHCQQMSKKR